MNSSTHKVKALRVWFIVLSALFAFLFIVTLVLTQVLFLYNTINSVLGGERRYLKSGNPDDYRYYTTDYESKEDVLAAAQAFNEEIVEEGIVLLKNDAGALPLSGKQKITVFGRNSVNIVLGGSGSNQGDVGGAITDVNDSLTAAGFEINPVIREYYKNVSAGTRPEVAMGSTLTGYPICEAPLPYSQEVQASYADYDDAAVVVISRTGGEGFDLPRTMFWDGRGYTNWGNTERQPVTGARSADDHYLQLDAYETAMLAEACENFDKVIVVVNSASPVELGFLDDPGHYAYHENIQAALWLGHPGSNGLNALGRVLSGEVNPSGRTVDTFARDFRNDPSWYNFGNYMTNEGNRYWTATSSGGEQDRNAWFVEYREGIYVGYRYYETMAAERDAADPGSGEQWYDGNVVYPFGYGLSYSQFDWNVSTPDIAGSTIDGDATIQVEVSVTNNGPYPGKEVLQLYYTAPYIAGGIEKAHVVLGDLIKTEELAVGQTETYTLSLDVRDMASYDYSDANRSGFAGYELDAGTYTFSVMKNSHEVVDSFECEIDETIKYEYSDVNEEVKVENRFDDVSGHIDEYLSREDCFANFNVLSGASERAYREISQEFANSLTWRLGDEVSDPWYAEDAPTQSNRVLSYKGTEVKLYDLIGKPHDDPLWDKLLDQLTVGQMRTLVSIGNYRTGDIENIGKPQTIDSDGPMGFASFMGADDVYSTCYYASESVLGATWNVDLAERFGQMVGDEALVGNEKGDGRTYSGWYAPAVNIHRSQFGGRNFEYYSEDSLLSGKMAAGVIQGAQSKGVYTYVKHFALNEQETKRDDTGLITWANEQSMRELYFRPFELAVKEGGTTAMMSSFNRIGGEWAGGSYRLLTEILREEWGFEGMVITDFNLKSYMNVDQMLRAGGDLNLSPDKGPSSVSTPTDITVLRDATHNILYTVANSNAMNGSGPGVVWGYALPWWVVWLIVADCGVFAVAATLCVFWRLRVHKNKQILNKTPKEAHNEE